MDRRRDWLVTSSSGRPPDRPLPPGTKGPMDPLDAWVLVRLPLGIVLGGLTLWAFRSGSGSSIPGEEDPGWLGPLAFGFAVGALAAWYLGGWIVRVFINEARAAKVTAAEIYLEELMKAASEGRHDLGAVMDERAARKNATLTYEQVKAAWLARQPNPWDALDEWIGDDATRTEGKRDLPPMRDGEDLTAYIERISKSAPEERD